MAAKNRWSDAVFYNTDKDILSHYEKNRHNCLYILGKGFDPRMMVGLSLVSRAVKICNTILIDFSNENEYTSSLHKEFVKKNIEKLKLLASNYKELKIPNIDNLPMFFKQELTVSNNYDRVIIDISSMPQSIYFNIIKHLEKYIKLQKINKRYIKLDIIACENSALDDAILPTDLKTANYLPGFDTYSNDLESDNNRISIWFPLLGKNCRYELDGLQSFLSPKEICPVLPFPSKNPRRSEEILLELGETIFTHLEIDKRNILYVAEQNVLDIYNKLHNTIRYYNEVLKEIGEPRFYVSTGSSKLIGLGVLLVHLELSESESETTISFAHVSNNGYDFKEDDYNPSYNQLCLLCMEDDRYEW